MKENEKEYPVNCIRICIEKMEKNTREIQGRISLAAMREDILFCSRTELLLKINEAFDCIGRPQSHQVLRTFTNERKKEYDSYQPSPTRYRTTEDIVAQTGDARTIDLMMISRGKAEWQGFLKDPSGKLIGRFNTSLECIGQI